MTSRTRATLIALTLVLLPMVASVPLSVAQVANSSKGAAFLRNNVLSPGPVIGAAGPPVVPVGGGHGQGDRESTGLKSSTAIPEEENGEIPVHDGQKITPVVLCGDVRNLPQVPQRGFERPELQAPFDWKQLLPEAHDPQKQDPNIPLAPMPAPAHFPGLSSDGQSPPPDTNGDVGPNHYIQAVNTTFGIYSKTGTLRAHFTENSLWAGSGVPQCDGNSKGDPVVVYDALADRWILTNLAFPGDGKSGGPFYTCVAVSMTGDPITGGWWGYGLRTDTGAAGQPPLGTLNDYPKFGTWTDCLYYSANGWTYNATTAKWEYAGPEFGSLSRSDMYAGLPLTWALGFFASVTDFSMLPSNLAAPMGALPSAGASNYYVEQSLTGFKFRVRPFLPGTNCGSTGTLGAVTDVSQSLYYSIDSSDPAVVPQPLPATSSNLLDSLGHGMMQKNQYRKVGSAESLWVTHTFRSSASGPTGSQWAQIDVTGGAIAATPVQQQLYDPADGVYRWMSSVAADKDGNVALGYSTSSPLSPNFPSIAYSGRLATDAANMLPQSETKLVVGSGSQVSDCGDPPMPCHRWGDYSAMSVDPTDGCTFWFTSEYYMGQPAGDTGAWSTEIGSFKFPSCGAAAGTLSVQLSASPASGTAPLSTSLSAALTGTATGTINYTFWWNCNYPGASVSEVTSVCGDPTNPAIGAKFDGVTANPKVVNHVYSSVGAYTAKVIAERGAASPAESRKTVTATQVGFAASLEFPIPTAGSNPSGITGGPDGNVWFAETQGNKIGRVTPAGAITEFMVPTVGSFPNGIRAGPDGNMWFTEGQGNKIGRITTVGVITEFPVPTAGGSPYFIAAGPDGNLWFTEFYGNRIGRITTAGGITEFTIPTVSSRPAGITAGPDGNVWFAENQGNKIARITPAGVISEFPVPTANSSPNAIVTGQDGNLWFTEFQNNSIARMTTAGVITEFTLPTPNSQPTILVAGPDGNLWFAETRHLPGAIGRITPSGVITEFPINNGESYGITAGPDGNIWFTELSADKIGRLCIAPTCPVSSSFFFTVAPCRVADTRNPPGPSGGPPLSANTIRGFPLTGICGIPPTAKAVFINLAVFLPTDNGDLRLFPAGGTAPLASTINFRPGIVRANNAIVPLGASGQISVQCDMPPGSPGSTNFFLDVYGYFE